MKPPRDLQDLLDKYFEGSCSEEELRAFYAWLRLAGEDQRLDDRLRREWDKAADVKPASEAATDPAVASNPGVASDPGLSSDPAVAPDHEPDWDRMFTRLTGHAREQAPKTGRSWKWAVAASLILVCVSTAAYFSFFQPAFHSLPGQSVLAGHTRDIQPGGNKAILTLADGSRIMLDSASNRLLARQGNTRIEKDDNGRLVYTSTHKKVNEGQSLMNTVSTPRGGQYHVRLPDGTDVWLNAESTLRFPALFARGSRRVELSGEAYFEVNRDEKRPFLVRSGTQEVEVLGTHFNISAYQDEPLIKTTLITGSIKVTERKSDQSRLLTPGHESTIAASGELRVAPAVPGQAIAWKNGKFFFTGERIESIMRKVARWYDVEIMYRGDIGNVHFTGSVSRFAEVADLLRKLELTGSVHFNIEGRRIIVMP